MSQRNGWKLVSNVKHVGYFERHVSLNWVVIYGDHEVNIHLELDIHNDKYRCFYFTDREHVIDEDTIESIYYESRQKVIGDNSLPVETMVKLYCNYQIWKNDKTELRKVFID